MVENLGRNVFWIVTLLVVAVLCMVVPDHPFRLGLDLQGGSRLVYSIDFEEAVEAKLIDASEAANPALLMQDTLDIIRERVDPNGVLEASFRPEGDKRFVVEIPRIANMATVQATAPLKEELRRGESTLSIDLDPQVEEQADLLRNFSLSGGVIAIGQESIRYGARDGLTFLDLERGYGGTEDAAHAAGEILRLVSDDPIRDLIETPGSLQFYIAAEVGDFSALGTTEQAERERVTAWVAANPGTSIQIYNRLTRAAGGAPDNILWFPRRLEAGQTEVQAPLAARLVPVLVQENEDWRFDGGALRSVNQAQDKYGYPAVGLEMTTERAVDFGNFTKQYKERLLGVTVNEELATLATINEPLYQRFQISGGARGFTQAEVKSMVKVLRSGSLRIKPRFEAEERIGASLGDEYVRRGAISAGLGLLAVLVFMVVYYRRLGVFAAMSLLATLVLLLGAMAFLRATLTLPGVAGILLTVGMAVDANILIYERIREESKRGRRIAQAAKHGFERAMVTIIDANLTTFITAAILRSVGTGPVRGFATTLMIGIITSMFAALVVTRVLVSVAISKGATGFQMSELVRDTKIAFMGMSKKVIPISLVLIVAGVALFASVPEKQKFSIDFLGGFTVTVRTQEPQSVDAIRAEVQQIPGDIGSADVTAILDSGSRADGYRTFRITYKGGDERGAGARDDEGAGQKTGESEIRRQLAGYLQEGPVVIEVAGEEASGRLYFDEGHPEADVATVLARAGLTEAQVTAVPETTGTYAFTAKVSPGVGENLLVSEISTVFSGDVKDGRGNVYKLADAVPEAQVVGAQVVGELRDKAIAAILISLFAVVMYIRVRFAEYSYGIAAVTALVHDVLMVLGTLAIADFTGFIDGQISLPMVAAFLTIIGYSLNDTIVVFDRVRENLPRMKGSLAEILDTSINQCLSRTLLTSATTFVAVVILLVFNYGGGSVLEGFAFAMLVGVVVGTYSSVFIASPVFLWLEGRAQKKAAQEEAAAAPAGARASS